MSSAMVSDTPSWSMRSTMRCAVAGADVSVPAVAWTIIMYPSESVHTPVGVAGGV